MRHFSHTSALRLIMRLLGGVGGVAIALLLFANVAAGKGYIRPHHGPSPQACSSGCFYFGLPYYYRDGLWYCYDGGQWYYFNPCWQTWVRLSGGGATIVSADGW